MTAPRYVLARRPGMRLDDFARCCGCIPTVRRLVALGLVAPAGCPRRSAVRTAALVRCGRIPRLRDLVWAELRGAVLVLDLLARIDEELEAGSAVREEHRMDPNRLTQKSQEALHDAQTKALRFAHRGRRRAPAARAARPARGPGPAAARSHGRRHRGAARGPGGELRPAPRVSGPGAAPGQVSVTQRLAACSRPPSGRPSASRTSTCRSSTSCSRCRRAQTAPPDGLLPTTASPGTASLAR